MTRLTDEDECVSTAEVAGRVAHVRELQRRHDGVGRATSVFQRGPTILRGPGAPGVVHDRNHQRRRRCGCGRGGHRRNENEWGCADGARSDFFRSNLLRALPLLGAADAPHRQGGRARSSSQSNLNGPHRRHEEGGRSMHGSALLPLKRSTDGWIDANLDPFWSGSGGGVGQRKKQSRTCKKRPAREQDRI